MKTPNYYRLDEKVSGMRGGKLGIKSTISKVKDYGIRAKKQVKLRMSKLGEKSFLGFKTKSHKARRKADKATGLSSRDREFIAKITLKTGNRTGYSDNRKAAKISKIMKKLNIETQNKSNSLGAKRIQERVNLIKKAYAQKQQDYKNSFEKNNKTITQKQSFLTTKQNYTDRKAKYNTLVKNSAIAESRRKLLKSSGLNTRQSRNKYTQAQTNAKTAQDALNKFNVKGLKNSREAFSKAEKKYSKRLTQKKSIEQLNNYSKNQTLVKRAKRTAVEFVKDVKSVKNALTNPMNTYRKIRGTRSSFTKLLNGSKSQNQTKNIKNRLRQEFDKNPEKRAEMEKSVYAIDALTLPKNIELPPININKSWSATKKELEDIIEGKGLLETERNIIMDGYKSKFLMEHLKQDEKTMNKKVVKATEIEKNTIINSLIKNNSKKITIPVLKTNASISELLEHNKLLQLTDADIDRNKEKIFDNQNFKKLINDLKLNYKNIYDKLSSQFLNGKNNYTKKYNFTKDNKTDLLKLLELNKNYNLGFNTAKLNLNQLQNFNKDKNTIARTAFQTLSSNIHNGLINKHYK
jgi:hypothetical protein